MKSRITVLLLAVLLSACSLLAPKNDSAKAEQALITFFDHLSQGEYDQADAMYGASYEPLTYFNPSLPPEDHVALWRNGCEINGYQCLPILRIIRTEKFSLNEFMITVEFKGADGQAFVFGPCCGASEEDMPPESQFEMYVIERDGQYLVTSLPVYVP